jgi:hypothetical protein
LRSKPVRTVGQDPRHVSQRLDVVHKGGVVLGGRGEQPEHERARDPRQGRPVLDYFFQTCLFSEQVEIWPENHFDLCATESVGLAHLLEGAVDRADFLRERLLDPDEAAFGTNGVGCDRQAFQDLIRVGPEEVAIFEGRRFSFGPVAYGEPCPRACRPDRSPLLAGGEAPAASAAEAALDDLLDNCLGGGTQGDLEATTSARLQILRQGCEGLLEE